MSKYTNNLTAEQLIYFIANDYVELSANDYVKLSANDYVELSANDYVELSHNKIVWQRDDHMIICREWLLHNIMNNIEPNTSVEIYVKDDF